MATKKTAARSGPEKRLKAETVLKLSRKAKSEVAKLLKRNQAGTITRVRLDTGLKEVKKRLRVMTHFVRQLL
jgi:hypothetical protein